MRRLPPLRAGGSHAFDILSLNGRDLRALPLIERKRELEQVLRDCVRIR
jgi:ATP-dependent DNA ligase